MNAFKSPASRISAGLALGLLLAATSAATELRLHRAFTDHMVIQRDRPVAVRGTGAPGATVTVAFGDQRREGRVADDGRWEVRLEAMPASAEGRTLRVRASEGDREIRLTDVLVGDVWLFGRQTWVDVTLGRTDEGRAAAAAYEPTGTFRVLRITTTPAMEPQDDLDAEAVSGWMPVDRDRALTISGAAFHLGRDLDRQLDAPVGIIDVDMGPSFALGWLSDRALAEAAARYPNNHDVVSLPPHLRRRAEERLSGQAQQALEDYYAQLVEEGRRRNRPVRPKPSLGLHPLRNPMLPSVGYNAVIHPLRGTALRGVLLQLGNDYPFIAYGELAREGKAQIPVELDAAWQENYVIIHRGFRVTPFTLPYVPGDWRRAFGRSDLPIGLLLPPSSDLDVYAQHNREVRELHRRTAAREQGLGLILPGMQNVPFSGQPADEALLGERSLHWVLGAVYERPDTPATGPFLDRIEAHFSQARVHFEEGTADGLTASESALEQFEAAGADGAFFPARARIDGNTVVLESDTVPMIAFVRYNWTEHPDAGLVNAAGLPALPFTTDANWSFSSIVPPESPDLPREYLTTADQWGESDIALINAQASNLPAGDDQPIPLRPGPIGIRAFPFGPNISVLSVDADSPADGKLQPGDIIFGANGVPFGDDTYREFSAAITESESARGEGRLRLGIRREGQLMEVELQLEGMGDYSPTTPHFCAKTDRIVRRAEEAAIRLGRPNEVESPAPAPEGFLNTDILFLLATGTPEVQGLARRGIYALMNRMDPLEPPEVGAGFNNWRVSYHALALGEYYHATGDANVLPYLENQLARLVLSQLKPEAETLGPFEAAQTEEVIGGWRHRYPTAPDRWQSGYGLLPHVGMAAVMGMVYAREAGADIDERAYERGLTHLRKGRAEHAFIMYAYGNLRRDAPPPIDPAREAAGMLSTDNGKLGNAAALFRLVDDWSTVAINARHSVYAFNNTRHGHGGMFFNNYWTPIGAAAAGTQGYRHFMRNQIWWRELFRRHDGRFEQAGRGGVGVAYGIHYLAPRQRLRMLGAPRTAFGPHAPDYLAPALAAHRARDYARAEALVRAYKEENILPPDDIPVVEHFLETVRILQRSIEHDLALVESQLEEGRYYHASLELPQLQGVVAADEPRLRALVAALESPEGAARIQAQQRAIAAAQREARDALRAEEVPEAAWISLLGTAEPEASDQWRMRLTEHIRQAPDGWYRPDFDDGNWDPAGMPISWAMYHTPLFRTRFHVEDPDALEALRIRGFFFQQMNVVIYLNGELVAKVDEIGRGGSEIVAPLTDLAQAQLRPGENTLAVSSRHRRRWGPMRGTYTTVVGGGFRIDLEGQVSEDQQP